MTRPSIVALLTVMVAIATGCATAPRSAEPAPPAQQTEPAVRLAPGIYRVTDGARLAPDTLYDALADHRFIIVGERHDDPAHHRAQRQIYAAVTARADGPVALGMEMFQRPFQAALDDYAAGRIDEATMLERTEYASRWGFDPDFYRDAWRLAAQRNAPIVALNAPRELSRRVAQVGLAGLEADERAQVPDELDHGLAGHRQMVRRAFEAHGMPMDQKTFERFYSAQVLWDETMAATAVERLEAAEELAGIVIFAGTAHADRRWGIAPRIARRTGRPDQVVTVLPLTHGAPAGAGPTSVEQAREQGSADYLWVVVPEASASPHARF